MKEEEIIYKRKSTVTIFAMAGTYYCEVTGQYGGGFSGACAGRNAEAAALFALQQDSRFIKSNPLGGDLFAPREVREEIEKLRAPAPADQNVVTGIPWESKTTKLLCLIDRVQCALGEIHMMYRDHQGFTQKVARLHLPVLYESTNLIYFLQAEAKRSIPI